MTIEERAWIIFVAKCQANLVNEYNTNQEIRLAFALAKAFEEFVSGRARRD